MVISRMRFSRAMCRSLSGIGFASPCLFQFGRLMSANPSLQATRGCACLFVVSQVPRAPEFCVRRPFGYQLGLFFLERDHFPASDAAGQARHPRKDSITRSVRV